MSQTLMHKSTNNVPVSGPKLAKLREDKGYTQEELAQMIGMTRGGVARIEGEERTGMNKRKFRALAEFLKIDVTDLRVKLAPNEVGDIGSVKGPDGGAGRGRK